MRALLLLLFLSATLSAQYRITGLVVDDITSEPVPFASVFLEADQSKGVLTNELGAFSITLDSTERYGGTLVFSSIAYQPRFVPLADADEELTVRLETQFLELPGVIVLSDLILRQLMFRALERVPENYGADDYLIKAYHRSYFATNAGFAQMNEAYLTIRDEPYAQRPFDERNTKVWIDQMKVTEGSEAVAPAVRQFFDRQSFLSLGYNWIGNPIYNQRLADIFGTKGEGDLRYLTFQQTGTYLSNSDTLVRIRFTLDSIMHERDHPGSYRPIHIGEAVINKTDLAFLELKVYLPDNPTAVYTAYQKVGGKYYPQRSSFSWALGEDYYQFPRIFNVFFYVTEVVTDPQEIRTYRKGKRIQGSEPMSNLNIRYDPDFWQGEERLLQLPADESMKFQMQKLLDIPEMKADTVSRDSSK